MKKAIPVVLASLIWAVPQMSLAGKDSGFYIGASLASSEFESDDNDLGADVDDSDTSYKVFGGYNFGLIPIFDLALEATYIDFGKHAAEENNVQTGNVETTGLMASVLGAFNTGPFGLFAKLGVVNWDSDFKGFSTDTNESGTDAAYGIGAKVQIASFQVRAEYELFQLDSSDINYASIGVAYTF